MKKILGVLIIGMLVFIGNASALTAQERQQIRAQAQEKRTTIRTNFIALNDLRNQLRSKISEAKTLLKSYRDAGTLTQEQIDTLKAKIKAIKDARQAVRDEYGRVVSIIAQYKADKSEGKLAALDKIIALQNARKTMLQNAVDSIK